MVRSVKKHDIISDGSSELALAKHVWYSSVSFWSRSYYSPDST